MGGRKTPLRGSDGSCIPSADRVQILLGMLWDHLRQDGDSSHHRIVDDERGVLGLVELLAVASSKALEAVEPPVFLPSL